MKNVVSQRRGYQRDKFYQWNKEDKISSIEDITEDVHASVAESIKFKKILIQKVLKHW